MTGHCEKHDQNTEDITTMKGNMKLLMWMAPLALVVAGSVCGYTLSNVNDNIKTVSASVGRIETTVQQSALTAEHNGTRLDLMEKAYYSERK